MAITGRRRFIAIFLLIVFFLETITTTVSYALTSGPTAPEATSFEPVDTTDMVNLATGDFTYNIPLLEVPGPSGGYPLALSYHGGIMPDEEASWVGLGWSLNPGAISRTVNGFADDHFGAPNTEHTFWSGGERTTFTVGVTIGISGVGGVSANLAFSQDTYQGFGVGSSIGISFGLSDHLNVGITYGVDPFSGPYASAGVNLGLGGTKNSAIGLSVGAGVSTNFDSITGYSGISASVGYDKPKTGQGPGGTIPSSAFNKGNVGIMGASISTNPSNSVSLSVAGWSPVNNSKSDNISTRTNSFTLPLPFVHLGYSHTRYWIDEVENVLTNGALYNPTTPVSGGFDANAYDSYTLLDPTGSIVDNPDPDLVAGGSFLNYDNYNVNAQGLGGYIRPYSFKNLAFRQNRKKTQTGYDVKQFPYTSGYSSEPFEFRFVGEFSNKFIKTGGEMLTGIVPLVPTFNTVGSVEETGENSTPQGGLQNGHLMGSRHIEWYTNAQILNLDNSKNPESDGFIDCTSTGYTRSHEGNLGTQIGAFKITNESGVTYHFALPAYSYDEYSYSENNQKDKGDTYRELKRPEKYAYTWFLTAITGPDFVDRGGAGNQANGKLDENDWGYWIEFNYGKWSGNYPWRNPATGYDRDLDNDFDNYSSGIKEVYYLDAIKTKSHTALFIKEVRADAKSTAFAHDLLKNSDYGFGKSSYTASTTTTTNLNLANDQCSSPNSGDFQTTTTTYTHQTAPVSTLALRSINLIENSSLKNAVLNTLESSTLDGLKTNGTPNYSIPITKRVITTQTISECAPTPESNNCACNIYQGTTSNVLTAEYATLHQYESVLETTDLSSTLNNVLTSITIRKIEFGNSYRLVPETPNSSNFVHGKLTLENLKFLGKAGSDLMPPLVFGYELENPKEGTGHFTKDQALPNDIYAFINTSSSLEIGDIIKAVTGNGLVYAVVKDILGNVHTVQILGKNVPPINQIFSWSQTKNPPYHNEKRDLWGMYKADYSLTGIDLVDRLVTEISSKNVDAWSLRRIIGSTGATISVNYESDTYTNSIKKLSNLVIKDVSIDQTNPSHVKLTFQNQVDLTTVSQLGPNATVQLYGMFRYLGQANPGQNFYACDGKWQAYGYHYDFIDENVQVVSVSSNYIIVQNAALTTQINTIYGQKYYNSYYGSFTASGISFSFNYPGQFIGGELYIEGSMSSIGGGLRVTAISVTDGNKISSTKFNYSGGTTSYEPLNMSLPLSKIPSWNNSCMQEMQKRKFNGYKTAHLNSSFGKNLKLLAISREIPPPGVVYQTAVVRESVNGIDLPNSSLYEFEVFSAMKVGHKSTIVSEPTPIPTGFDDILYTHDLRKDVTISDFTSKVGQLKRISLMDAAGNVLNETRNHYLDEEASGATLDAWLSSYGNKLQKFNSQGVIQETIMDGRFAKQENNEFTLLSTVSRKHYYPTILTGQTSINYKTGVSTTTHNLKYDFYSGKVLQTMTSDGYGNFYVIESVPSYRIGAYSSMGLAAGGGKNMLTQDAASYSFKVNSSYKDNPVNENIIAVTGANAQTWSVSVPLSDGIQGSGIWRKARNYSFIGDPQAESTGDGLFPIGSFSRFTAWTPSDPVTPFWEQTSEITLYDVASHALEVKDINDKFAATKLTANGFQVLATSANSRYGEFCYSGAEEDLPIPGAHGGGVYINGAKTSQAHTGLWGVTAATGSRGFTYTMDPLQRTYVISVWSSQADANIKYIHGTAGTVTLPVTQTGKAGPWYLLEAQIAADDEWSTLEIWCEAKVGTTVFDDFRVSPLDAATTSYVYNSWGELTHSLDVGNLFTEFQYDGMGRLLRTYREVFDQQNMIGKTKINEQEYNFALNGTRLDANVTLQSSQSLLATVYFGHGPYKYEWIAPNQQPVIVNSASLTSTFTSTETCPHIVLCKITDARDATVPIETLAGAEVISAQFDGPPQEQALQAGTPYTFVSNFVGSCGPYTRTWAVGPLTGPFNKVGGASILEHTFSQCGRYQVTLTISNQFGWSETSSINYYVSGGLACIEY